MKNFFRDETESTINHLKKNWDSILFSLALGLLVFWILTFNQVPISFYVKNLYALKPNISLFLIFEVLILLAISKKTVSLWSHYRHAYFIKEMSLSWIDRILIFLLPVVYWLDYQSFVKSNYFSYAIFLLRSFILITYIFSLVPFIKDFLKRRELQKDKFEEKTILFSDEPINETEDDLIGRSKFALALKENIYNLSFKESFVMALYGRWGEGKTSILNLLRKQILEDNRILIYEFDPWFFGDENALTTNFYRGLEDLLQEDYFIPRKIKKVFKFYPEILIKGFASFGIEFSANKDEDRPVELKKEIEEFISGLNKRILVIIDDIDRLQRDEILAVFRLVKLTSHIKNLVFLVSFDASRVINILKDSKEFEDPQKYIEKIVQLPINIPMTDPNKIDQFLFWSVPTRNHVSEIDKLFNRLNLDKEKREEFDKEFTKIYQSDLRQLFTTYRATKRYLNSILFRLPFIEKEVRLYDFFIVEIIQTFYPELYADMKSSPWYYLSYKWSLETMVTSPLPYDDTQRKEAIRKHIEKLIEKYPQKDIIQSLLSSIFPQVHDVFSHGSYHTDSSEARIKKRISHPECYPKYFMLANREGVIPDEEFETMLEAWKVSDFPEDEIIKTFYEKYQKEFKLLELIEKLKLHSKNLDPKLVSALINVIRDTSDKLDGNGELWMTEFDQAEGLMFRLIEDREDVIKNEQIQITIEDILEKTPSFDLASLIVLTCKERETNSLRRVISNVQVDKLKNIVEKRLSVHFVDNEKDIFEEYRRERQFIFVLYQWATNWGSLTKDTRDKVNDYLINLFKKKPNLISFFLKYQVKDGRGWNEDKKFFDYQGFVVAYDANKFIRTLDELGDKAFSTESEKQAVTLFREEHKKAVEQGSAEATGVIS